MAQIFHYGPYTSVSRVGLPPGKEETWTWGPSDWYASTVTITAHPLHRSGSDQALEVSRISARAAVNGGRFINATVRNVGRDPVNYAVWLGGVRP
jgi:hypothetical protein